MIRRGRECWVIGWLLVVLVWPARAEIAEIGYSFAKENTGGIATVRVDTETGKILGQELLFESSDCRQPAKLRRSSDGQTLVVTNLDQRGPHLFFASVNGSHKPRRISLKGLPDELRITGGIGVMTSDDDYLFLVDIPNAKVLEQRDVEKIFDPPANAPEDVFLLPSGEFAVTSFQKDSRQGKKLGNRLAVFKLPEFKRLADLQLPRSRPDLHIEGNLKEQGPGPEVIHVSTDTDTLIVTLDLYGAVGLMDWSEAQQGRIRNWKMLSTSTSGDWGNAFPDRGALAEIGEQEYYLVFNAGLQGGSALVSLDARQIVWRHDVPPGLEKPHYLKPARKAYSVCSGKTKQRGDKQVTKNFSPRKSIYEFDFSSDVKDASLNEIPLDLFAVKIAVLGNRPPILLVAAGKTEKPDRLITFDPSSLKVKDKKPALGTIARLEAE